MPKGLWTIHLVEMKDIHFSNLILMFLYMKTKNLGLLLI